jgi:Fic-DOC domain mobile mystery protein B
MKIEYPPGATPLDLDDWEALVPSISTHGQLNEFEAQNIQRADQWARENTRLRRELPSVATLLRLHKQMFGDTWKWAGQCRKRNLSIGIDWTQVTEQVGALCGDARCWIEAQSWRWPEIAVRFHHRLVSIHPFVNGNGRHARLAADLLLDFNGQPRLGWGGGSLIEPSARRAEYIAALREADAGSLDRLVRFAQTR